MKFNVLLAEFYHWASDVKRYLLTFDEVEESELSSVVMQCIEHEDFGKKPYVSIIIDAANDRTKNT